MAIKGKTILLELAYCKQAERKVELVRVAVWREVQKMKKVVRGGGGGGGACQRTE